MATDLAHFKANINLLFWVPCDVTDLFASHLQGDGWIYSNPLWKSTWQQTDALLMDRNTEDSDQELTQTQRRPPHARDRDSEWQKEEMRKLPKESPRLQPGNGLGLLCDWSFYIQLIVLLFRVEYFYFSPCQGLFCTCRGNRFVIAVFSFKWSTCSVKHVKF